MSNLKEQGRKIKENAKKYAMRTTIIAGIGAAIVTEPDSHTAGFKIGAVAIGAGVGRLADRFAGAGESNGDTARLYAQNFIRAVEGAGAVTMMGVGAPTEVILFTTGMFAGGMLEAVGKGVNRSVAVFRKRRDKNKE